MHRDKTQILKKIPWHKINVTKNALFFLSRAPTHHTHHSFTFNFSKSVCVGFSILYFCSNKSMYFL